MKKVKSRVVIRADGNSVIGLGHVTRCLALAALLDDDFSCCFMIKQPAEPLIQTIAACCEVIQLPGYQNLQEEKEALKQLLLKTDILVLDSYDVDTSYQQELKAFVHKLVVIDDNAAIYFYADIIINQGGAAMKDRYRSEKYTKLLLGFPYVLLRSPFLAAAKQQRVITETGRLFICMGGADPFNVTVKVLTAALQCHFVRSISIVTGSAYNNMPALGVLLQDNTKEILHEQHITAERMVQLIGNSDIAICPASSIAIEACSVKTGLLTGTTAGNQQGIAGQLTEANCAVTVGDFNTISLADLTTFINRMNNVALLNGLIENQSRLIDGLSGERLLHEFKMLAAC